jgi:hypothetical protein
MALVDVGALKEADEHLQAAFRGIVEGPQRAVGPLPLENVEKFLKIMKDLQTSLSSVHSTFLCDEEQRLSSVSLSCHSLRSY